MTEEDNLIKAEEEKQGPGIVGTIRWNRERIQALEKRTAELEKEVRQLKSKPASFT